MNTPLQNPEVSMRRLGLLGGMSWESTLTYYRLLNEGVRDRLGGYHSADLLIRSVDFAVYESNMRTNRWDLIGLDLSIAARELQNAGAEGILLCTNSMHHVADSIVQGLDIPLLHIADAAGRAVQKLGIRRVALLGTRFTMEFDFYVNRLRELFQLDVRVPDADARDMINRVIFEELVLGKVLPESRNRYLEVMNTLVRNGAQGVILGCTEIGLLITPDVTAIPLFDTTVLHAELGVDFMLQRD